VPASAADPSVVHCADCGATWRDADAACQARFDRLLALDHSHREPWGSRHGLAFAVYALQHPTQFPATSRVAARDLLTAVYRRGEDVAWAVGRLRTAMADSRRSMAPADVVPHPRRGFAVTIDGLGDFDAEHYVADLERWCRATLEALDAADA